MPRREVTLEGPRQATLEDIPAINALFSEAFTDRYQRDGMAGVRVPALNPAVWRYALEGAGAGAMAWQDEAGEIAAFNIVHASGTEGWMGPLAVRPGLQHRGVGATIVREGIRWLRARGARVIGLETMPRTVDNIGFYSRLGFLPGHLTLSLARPASRRRVAGATLLGARAAEGERLAGAVLDLTTVCAPGVDFTREVDLTRELELGDVTLLERGGRLVAFALWHGVALAAGRAAEEVRILKLVAEDVTCLPALLDAVGSEAAARGRERVVLRAQAAYQQAYAMLVESGWRIQWTDLRMALAGHAEPVAAAPAVVFSNWEI